MIVAVLSGMREGRAFLVYRPATPTRLKKGRNKNPVVTHAPRRSGSAGSDHTSRSPVTGDPRWPRSHLRWGDLDPS
jgi:hypothetical protein